MSADLLRKAAEILRERADKATTGDGQTLSREWSWDLTYMTRNQYEVVANGEGSLIAERLDRWTATYIATMHPGVGLALANALDSAADYEDVEDPGGDGEGMRADLESTARLIVGGAS